MAATKCKGWEVYQREDNSEVAYIYDNTLSPVSTSKIFYVDGSEKSTWGTQYHTNDAWTEKLTLDNYTDVDKAIEVIKPGTFPQFIDNTRIDLSTPGMYTLELTEDNLLVKDSNNQIVDNRTKTYFKDGVIPSRFILMLQGGGGAGGRGGNSSSHESGGGGGSGGLFITIIKLDRNTTYYLYVGKGGDHNGKDGDLGQPGDWGEPSVFSASPFELKQNVTKGIGYKSWYAKRSESNNYANFIAPGGMGGLGTVDDLSKYGLGDDNTDTNSQGKKATDKTSRLGGLGAGEKQGSDIWGDNTTNPIIWCSEDSQKLKGVRGGGTELDDEGDGATQYNNWNGWGSQSTTNQSICFSKNYTDGVNKYTIQGQHGGSQKGYDETYHYGGGGAASYFVHGGDCAKSDDSWSLSARAAGNGTWGSGGGGGERHSAATYQHGGAGGNGFIRLYY